MSVYYPCPKCSADVDDNNEWIKEFPLKYCSASFPFHENCGYESHLEYCPSSSCEREKEIVG